MQLEFSTFVRPPRTRRRSGKPFVSIRQDGSLYVSQSLYSAWGRPPLAIVKPARDGDRPVLLLVASFGRVPGEEGPLDCTPSRPGTGKGGATVQLGPSYPTLGVSVDRGTRRFAAHLSAEFHGILVQLDRGPVDYDRVESRGVALAKRHKEERERE